MTVIKTATRCMRRMLLHVQVPRVPKVPRVPRVGFAQVGTQPPEPPEPLELPERCSKLRRMANNSRGVSRRDLLKRAGLAGAALTMPVTPAIPAGLLDQSQSSAPKPA